MAQIKSVPEENDNTLLPTLAETHFEASNLLKNGILVETSKGLVCMSLNDALSSNLNLSAEDLQELATQLILQESLHKESSDISDTSFQINSDFCSTDTTADSDDPTSEGSDNLGEKSQNLHKSLDDQNNAIAIVPSVACYKYVIQPSTSIDSDTNVTDNVNKLMVNCINRSRNDNLHKNIPKLFDQKPLSTSENTDSPKLPVKRKGGWPKGRKRKPEVLHLPPKAPATGYTLYLNEMRKSFKDSSLAFYEITKILGNKWSSLSLEEKKPYLNRAEEEKKRYREELRVYRQSGAYQLYLAKKRKKKVQNNILSESDMDATDDFDDEDNEELYCRTCDQWFHSLHNKKEHLQGRQHLQAVAGHIRALEIDHSQNNEEVNCTTVPYIELDNFDSTSNDSSSDSVTHAMANLLSMISKRDMELKTLKERALHEKQTTFSLNQHLQTLQQEETRLKNELSVEMEKQKDLESQILYFLGMTYING